MLPVLLMVLVPEPAKVVRTQASAAGQARLAQLIRLGCEGVWELALDLSATTRG